MAAQTLTLLDKRLLDLAAQGASPEEMAEDTGLPGGAQEAYQRVTGILRQRSIWNEVEQRQLLLHSAYALKAQLEKWIVDQGRYTKDQVTSYIQTLKLLSEVLEKHTKATENQVEAMVDGHKAYMIGLVEKLSVAAIDALHKEHPELTASDIDAAFQEAMSKERVALNA